MKKEVLEFSFDFSIRLVELVRYLQDIGKIFPLSDQLLLYGVDTGVCLRLSMALEGKERAEHRKQALRSITSCLYLLDLLVKTDYLTEAQSRPIREDCSELQRVIAQSVIKKKDSPSELPCSDKQVLCSVDQVDEP